jgi:hypothetical protein
MECVDNGFLASKWGGGSTPEIALKDFARAIILFDKVVFNAGRETRVEFGVPKTLTS